MILRATALAAAALIAAGCQTRKLEPYLPPSPKNPPKKWEMTLDAAIYEALNRRYQK